jgi:hypothetical protein
VKFIAFSFIFILGCTLKNPSQNLKEDHSTYNYLDSSGTYKLVRESKKVSQKIVTRQQMMDDKKGGGKLIEKSIIVSRIGSIKNKSSRLLILRPEASEYTVWLEGKKYSSRLELNPRGKTMKLMMESPEKRWQGTSEVTFPKGKYFCFFNQLPECLRLNFLLSRALEQKSQRFHFYLIWDSYPYVQEIFNQVGTKLFTPASVKYDGTINGLLRFVVELDGQVVVYQLNRSFHFIKMAWISQGVTIAPPGEENHDEE